MCVYPLPQHPRQPWRQAVRPPHSIPHHHSGTETNSTPTFSPTIINSLQSRSLTESDYELLLQLDNQGGVAGSTPQRVPERIINSFHVEPLDSHSSLLQQEACCQLCMNNYQRGDWIKKLPCKHKVCYRDSPRFLSVLMLERDYSIFDVGKRYSERSI